MAVLESWSVMGHLCYISAEVMIFCSEVVFCLSCNFVVFFMRTCKKRSRCLVAVERYGIGNSPGSSNTTQHHLEVGSHVFIAANMLNYLLKPSTM